MGPTARRTTALVAAGTLCTASLAGEDLRNWFDDPFFIVSAAVANCPEPAGPRVTPAERQVQSHRRAEKGTTCWLARECDRPNAYAYDRDIAAEIQAAAQTSLPLQQTSLWVTVQGRVVYVEGCAASEPQAAEIEARIRVLPHVQQALVIVSLDPAAKPPYRRLVDR